MQTNPDTPTGAKTQGVFLEDYNLPVVVLCFRASENADESRRAGQSACTFAFLRILNREGSVLEYIVRYSPQYDKKYPLRQKKNKRKTLKVCAVIIALLVCTWGIKNRNILKQWLLPADTEQAQKMISAFVEDMRAGKSFKDAATTFCLEVLDHAQVAIEDPV